MEQTSVHTVSISILGDTDLRSTGPYNSNTNNFSLSSSSTVPSTSSSFHNSVSLGNDASTNITRNNGLPNSKPVITIRKNKQRTTNPSLGKDTLGNPVLSDSSLVASPPMMTSVPWSEQASSTVISSNHHNHNSHNNINQLVPKAVKLHLDDNNIQENDINLYPKPHIMINNTVIKTSQRGSIVERGGPLPHPPVLLTPASSTVTTRKSSVTTTTTSSFNPTNNNQTLTGKSPSLTLDLDAETLTNVSSSSISSPSSSSSSGSSSSSSSSSASASSNSAVPVSRSVPPTITPSSSYLTPEQMNNSPQLMQQRIFNDSPARETLQKLAGTGIPQPYNNSSSSTVPTNTLSNTTTASNNRNIPVSDRTVPLSPPLKNNYSLSIDRPSSSSSSLRVNPNSISIDMSNILIPQSSSSSNTLSSSSLSSSNTVIPTVSSNISDPDSSLLSNIVRITIPRNNNPNSSTNNINHNFSSSSSSRPSSSSTQILTPIDGLPTILPIVPPLKVNSASRIAEDIALRTFQHAAERASNVVQFSQQQDQQISPVSPSLSFANHRSGSTEAFPIPSSSSMYNLSTNEFSTNNVNFSSPTSSVSPINHHSPTSPMFSPLSGTAAASVPSSSATDLASLGIRIPVNVPNNDNNPLLTINNFDIFQNIQLNRRRCIHKGWLQKRTEHSLITRWQPRYFRIILDTKMVPVPISVQKGLEPFIAPLKLQTYNNSFVNHKGVKVQEQVVLEEMVETAWLLYSLMDDVNAPPEAMIDLQGVRSQRYKQGNQSNVEDSSNLTSSRRWFFGSRTRSNSSRSHSRDDNNSRSSSLDRSSAASSPKPGSTDRSLSPSSRSINGNQLPSISGIAVSIPLPPLYEFEVYHPVRRTYVLRPPYSLDELRTNANIARKEKPEYWISTLNAATDSIGNLFKDHFRKVHD